MGKYYYVNKKAGFDRIHSVHTAGCEQLPSVEERQFLGTFYSDLAAIKQARRFYEQAEGCPICCPVEIKKPRSRHISDTDSLSFR